MWAKNFSHSAIHFFYLFLFTKSFSIWGISNYYTVFLCGCKVSYLHLFKLYNITKTCFIRIIFCNLYHPMVYIKPTYIEGLIIFRQILYFLTSIIPSLFTNPIPVL